MPRTETLLMSGWSFSLNRKEGPFVPVHLPHDWAISMPVNEHMEYGGDQAFRERWSVGYYRRELVLEEKKPGQLYFLDFGGVYECSSVTVNGMDVGGRKYGYSPFRLNVTDALQQGVNHIRVRVDNTQRPVDRWYSGCGIYRTVKLIEMAQRHLDEYSVVVKTVIEDGRARVHVCHAACGTVLATLLDGEAAVDRASGDDGRLMLSVASAKLWSAEAPHLYTLQLALMDGDMELDAISMRIGLRVVNMDPERGLMVNEEDVKLRGVCVHQDVGCRGNAAKQEIWRKRLALLKAMGCNALRPSHHVYSAEFLDLCDEMGFYVYEECFDKWTGGLYGRYFETEWRADVDAMVLRDRNRPSVLFWGVGNEVENQSMPRMLQILEDLVAHVHGLDDTRPVSIAINPHFPRGQRTDMSKVKDIQQFVDVPDGSFYSDPEEKVGQLLKITQRVDVICCNYQEHLYERIHAACPEKCILGTEVFQYFHGDARQFQNFVEKVPSLAPRQHPYVIGSMIWTAFDYLGESVCWPAKGWAGAMIRTNMERKPSYYMMQSLWSEQPMVHLSVMDYSLQDEGVKEHWDMPMLADHWHFPQFRRAMIPYWCFTNCEDVEIYLNGKCYYPKRPSECPNGIITGFLPYQPGELRVVGYQGGAAVCEQAIVTPDVAVQLAFDRQAMNAPAEEGYELLLTVRAKDRNGLPVFRESASVRFVTHGEAEIVGVDCGCLMSGETYLSDTVHMHHGVASVQVRLTGNPGRAVVSAFADGMFAGQCAISMRDGGPGDEI